MENRNFPNLKMGKLILTTSFFIRMHLYCRCFGIGESKIDGKGVFKLVPLPKYSILACFQYLNVYCVSATFLFLILCMFSYSLLNKIIISDIVFFLFCPDLASFRCSHIAFISSIFSQLKHQTIPVLL